MPPNDPNGEDADLADLLGDGGGPTGGSSSRGASSASGGAHRRTSPARRGKEADEDPDGEGNGNERERLLPSAGPSSANGGGGGGTHRQDSEARLPHHRKDPNAPWKAGKASASGFSYRPSGRRDGEGACSACGRYCTAYLSLLCYYHPWMCALLALGAAALLLASLANVLFSPVGTYGVVPHDHSNIRSVYDLRMAQIDHWCLGGGNDGCACEDPLTPTSQLSRKAWVAAMGRNLDEVRRYRDPIRQKELDVAFVGESLVEEMGGRWLGRSFPALVPVRRAFQSRFRRESGAKFEGVTLGIAGDTAPNVLYRLMHGEMPDHLKPKVWWLVLGMNDLSRMMCSEEVTVIGILRVVEEILTQRPESRVVINSLLPMVYSRGGQQALMHDFQDSLGEMGNKLKDRTKMDPPKAATDAVEDEKDGWRRKARRLRADKSAVNDDTEEEEQLETQIRKKEGKRDRGSENAVLDAEARKKRKFNLVSGLLPNKKAKNSPPWWTAIYAINRALKAFADKHENVEFFDATPIFAKQLPQAGKYELMSNLISARGHPTPAGFMAWEDAMIVRLDSILYTMKKQHPELFSVLDLPGTDDSAVMPNVTEHLGFGFEDENPPEVGISLFYDDDREPDAGTDDGENQDKTLGKNDTVKTPNAAGTEANGEESRAGGDQESDDSGKEGDDDADDDVKTADKGGNREDPKVAGTEESDDEAGDHGASKGTKPEKIPDKDGKAKNPKTAGTAENGDESDGTGDDKDGDAGSDDDDKDQSAERQATDEQRNAAGQGSKAAATHDKAGSKRHPSKVRDDPMKKQPSTSPENEVDPDKDSSGDAANQGDGPDVRRDRGDTRTKAGKVQGGRKKDQRSPSHGKDANPNERGGDGTDGGDAGGDAAA